MNGPLVNFLGGDLKITYHMVMELGGSQATLPQAGRKARGGLATDLAKQLGNPSFTDWTLVCEGEEIPCHKFMLGSRSPVFQAMFEQDGFQENQTCQTQIKVNKTD